MQIARCEPHDIQPNLQAILKLLIRQSSHWPKSGPASQAHGLVVPTVTAICTDADPTRSAPIHPRRDLEPHIDPPKPPHPVLQMQVQDRPSDPS